MNLIVVHAPTSIRQAFVYAVGAFWPEAKAMELDEPRDLGTGGQSDVDMIVVDGAYFGPQGAAGIRSRLGVDPGVPVAVLMSSVDLDGALNVLNGGGVGVIPKTLPLPTMIQALRLILSGEKYVPASVLSGARARIDESHENGVGLDRLTPREREVLELLLSGSSNKAIGRRLNLAEATVKAYMMTLCRKLGARNRAHAVCIALQHGFAQVKAA